MHQQHGDDARNVDVWRGVVGQYKREHGDVPAVLGVVFATLLSRDEVAPEDALSFVELQQELDPALQVGVDVRRFGAQGIRSTLPLVSRPWRAMCASAASASETSRSIMRVRSPAATQDNTSPARHSSSSRVSV